MVRGPLYALVSAIVLVVLAWLGCWAWDEIAAETKGDFPDGILCVLTWIAAVVGWFVLNVGTSLRR